jgi:mono/diheme cytochrome c family protein
MKHVLLSALVISFTFNACKSKKAASKTASDSPTEAQLTALKTKMPGASMDDLKKGRSIFYGACTNCHGAKDVTGFTEEELKKTVDVMAPKAKLSPDEKDAVYKYALAVNLSAKK